MNRRLFKYELSKVRNGKDRHSFTLMGNSILTEGKPFIKELSNILQS